ncbi:MAG: DNA gyrase C-terminal beta-propeller domain-containing protein [Microthrixaceae bacterium]
MATTTHSSVALLTTRARVFPVEVDDIEEVTGRKRGVPTKDLVPLEKGESVLCVVAPAVGEEPPPLLLVTSQGQMKRLRVEELTSTPNGRTAMKLRTGDSLVAAFPARGLGGGCGGLERTGHALSARHRARPGARGRRGRRNEARRRRHRRRGGACRSGSIVLTVSDARTAKVTDASEIPTKGRNTAGLRVTLPFEKRLEWAYVGPGGGPPGGGRPERFTDQARRGTRAAHPGAHGPRPGVAQDPAAHARDRLRPLVTRRTQR